MSIKKLKNKNGSALSLAIVVIAIVTIITGTISMQAINQIKSNRNSEDLKQDRYIAEAGIENGIAEFISSIDLEGEFGQTSPDFSKIYLDIVKQYILEAKYINGNNGNLESTLDEIITSIDAKDVKTVKSKMNSLITTIGEKPNEEKRLVKDEVLIGMGYINRLEQNINTTNSISNIKFIIQNININSNYCIRDILNNYSVAIEFEGSILNSSVDNYLGDLKNKVDDINQNINNSIINKDHNSLNRYISEARKYRTIISSIIKDMDNQPVSNKGNDKDYKYTVLIDNKDIKDYYKNGLGNKDFYLIVSNRMKTISLELQLIEENIIYLQGNLPPDENGDGQPDNPNGNGLIITIPESIENITQEGLEYQSRVEVDEYQDNNMALISNNNNEFKFNVLNTNGELIIYLLVESNYQGNSITSYVKMTINGIAQNNLYDVNYEIINWN